MKKVLYLLGALDHEDIEWIIEEGSLRTIKRGETLIERGEPANDLYVVLSGAFAVLSGKKLQDEIAKVETGEVLGELSLIDARPPGVSVVARQDGEILCVSKRKIKARLKYRKGFAGRFYYSLCLFLSHRLRQANEEADMDEIGENIMDQLHQAGSRFNQIVQEVRQRKKHL